MMVDYARMDGMDSQSEVSMGMPLSTRFYDTDSDTEQDFRIPRYILIYHSHGDYKYV